MTTSVKVNKVLVAFCIGSEKGNGAPAHVGYRKSGYGWYVHDVSVDRNYCPRCGYALYWKRVIAGKVDGRTRGKYAY